MKKLLFTLLVVGFLVYTKVHLNVPKYHTHMISTVMRQHIKCLDLGNEYNCHLE